MTPDDSSESRAARGRLFNSGAKPVEISMKIGDGEIKTATINVPDEALNADFFRGSIEDFVKDALAVRMIQVWVSYFSEGKETTTTLFVPVLGWHLLSVNWQIIIEDYVKEKLFNSPQTKISSFAMLYYRKNGNPGNPTRKERFHDWLVGLTGRGSTIFYRHHIINWDAPPMPAVTPPLSRSGNNAIK